MLLGHANLARERLEVARHDGYDIEPRVSRDFLEFIMLVETQP